jgi:hypothetical protein
VLVSRGCWGPGARERDTGGSRPALMHLGPYARSLLLHGVQRLTRRCAVQRQDVD